MKTLKYIGLFIASFMFAACAVDEMGSADAESLADNLPVVISISDKNMLPVDMMKTRAGGLNSVLTTVNDLNIRIHLKTQGAKPYNIYCDKSAIKVDGTVNKKDVTYVSGHEFASMLTNADKDVMLHLSKIKATAVEYVEVLANYGSPIPAGTDWATIRESQNPVVLLQTVNEINALTCMMYGKVATSSESSHVDPATKAPCKLFNVQLKRSRAMVTLQVNATGLKKGVEITPRELRICNAPKSCQLTALASTTGNKINTKEDATADAPFAITLGLLSNAAGHDKMGNHITDTEIPAKTYPFFIYENRQGVNANTGTHATKYPAGVTGVAQAKDRNVNYKASYIEILADYKYKEKAAVKIGGSIVYRFFLGENAVDNFNVEGNHYYKITLNLKGFGGAKEDGKTDASGNLVVNDADVSWRVDMDTKDWGFEKDQFDFDGHYIDGATNVVGTNWKFNKVVKGDGNASWLTINIQERYGQHWANPTTIVEQNCKLNIKDGQLRFNLQPMVYMTGQGTSLDPSGQFDENTYKQAVNYREMQIEVLNLDNQQTQIITVRQYAPIPVTVGGETFFMERFEEYSTDQATGQQNKGFPWMYKGDNLNKLKDLNGSKATYHWGNPNKNGVGLNSTYLRDIESASYQCYLKGQSGVIQGAEVAYYALPSQAMMEAMFNMANTYDKSWGPFEPMHMYEDYWTSTVEQATPTVTQYYDANTRTYKPTTAQHDRDQLKRVRAVYTVHQW